jgi:hypothetical protein
MVDNKQDLKSWSLTVLQIVVSLLFGGGIVFLFTEFKEHLPSPVYSAIIIIVAIVLILSLIVLVARVMFGDLVARLLEWNARRVQKSRTYKLAIAWEEHWLKLADLLAATWSSNTLPSREQENDFSKLHLWFLTRRNQFLPSWTKFIRQRPQGVLHRSSDMRKNSLSHYVFVEHESDPFSVFYEPLNLWGVAFLVKVCHVDNGWDTDEEAASSARFDLVILSELMCEYVSWV